MFSLTAPPAHASDKLIVSASRIQLSPGQSSVVIENDQLLTDTQTPEAIGKVPGISFARSGSQQGSTSVFIRGGEPGDTLVLLDGIELNDASNVTRFFDFANIGLANINRIEILKGPQSGLYGSDAMSGVINFVTADGKGDPSVSLHSGYGSFGTYKFGISSDGGEENSWYSISANKTTAQGFSTANDQSGQPEDDGFDSTVIHAKAGLKFTDNQYFEAVARYQHRDSDIDRGGGEGNDDPNFRDRTRFFASKLEHHFFLFDEKFESTSSVQSSYWKRNSRNSTDLLNSDDTETFFDSVTQKFLWQGNFRPLRNHEFAVGYEHEKESMNSESVLSGIILSRIENRKANTNAVFVIASNKFGLFSMVNNLRWNDFSAGDDTLTYRTAPQFVFGSSGLSLSASYGNGIKNPTLFQLFSDFGSQNLKQEKLQGFDVSLAYDWQSGQASIGYFSYDVKSQIDFDLTTNTYFNVDESERDGIEFTTRQKWHPLFSTHGSYTYLVARDKSTGLSLLRRPRHRGSFSFVFEPRSSLHSSLNFEYQGSRDDIEAETLVRVRQPSFLLVNWAIQLAIKEQHRFSLHLNNVFDKKYESVNGFTSPGTNFMLQYSVRI